MALRDSVSRTERTSIVSAEPSTSRESESGSDSRSGSGVESGHMIFAISSAAGAFITVAASRYSSGAPSSE